MTVIMIRDIIASSLRQDGAVGPIRAASDAYAGQLADRVLVALEAAGVRLMRWRPIEDAPRGSRANPVETRALLSSPEFLGVVCGSMYGYPDAVSIVGNFHGDWKFDHFMPLPEPP
jgi:hypothetical protein